MAATDAAVEKAVETLTRTMISAERAELEPGVEPNCEFEDARARAGVR